VFVRPSGEQLGTIAGLFHEGRLRVHLSAVLPLEQAAMAHERIETGHTRGKLVLSV
jgi:NADPH:quinone reductase-like Zn-dependent oxidoreductase